MGTGTAGAANATSNFDQTLRNVRSAIEEACQDITAPELCKTHIGLAGIMSNEDGTRLATALGLPQVTVSDDSATTVAGALAGRDGVVGAVGTGSLFGAITNGKTRHIGGWGLHLGDQASGAWLGRALLQQVMLVHDGLTASTDLTETTWAKFNDPNQLVAFAAQATPKDFATFAPNITKAATNGDTTATALMKEGAAYLNLAFRALDPGVPAVFCLTGGLGEAYAEWLAQDVANRLTPPAGTALDGALYLAKHQ